MIVGCSSDDDSTPTVDSGTVDTAIQPDTQSGTDAAQTFNFVGLVEGFGEDGAMVEGVRVEIYDNDTGQATGTVATSDENGKVTFPGLIKGKLYGFKASKAPAYKNTFVWNIVAGDYAEETLWAVSNTVYNIALGLAGLTPEAGKSMVAGAVYWVNAQDEEEGIGCAKVTTDPTTPDVRYMAPDNGLPTTLENQACTATKDTEGNGRFVAANLTPGQVTTTAKGSDDAVIGSTTFWSVADSIAVSNIYAVDTITSNPTPGSCACTP
jgi:hypothetical protein